MVFGLTRRTDESWRDKKLAMPLVLEDGRMPGLVSSFLYVASALVFAAIVWASVVQIRELAPADGELRPSGSVQLVQHLEGGIVGELLAREGERVEAGAPLVRLQPAIAQADRNQLGARAANLALQKIRIEALLSGREPDFRSMGQRYPRLAAEQSAAFDSERAEMASQRQGLQKAIDKSRSEAETLRAQAESLDLQLDIQKERLTIFESLASEGLVSRTTYLETRQRFEQTRFDLLAKQGQLQVAEDTLAQAEIALREAVDTRRRELASRLADITGEFAEVEQSLSKQQDRVTRLLVVAPVAGIVQEIVPKAPGEVISPGGDVARIVPAGEEIVAEVRVNPRDIAHVRIGAPVKVSVSAFDAAKAADIDGEVRKVSASTFFTDKGEPYYKAEIALLTTSVRIGGNLLNVQPGMLVQAKIVTGAKSLMTYLLKPVRSVVDNALSER